jgi:hypothetical protein
MAASIIQVMWSSIKTLAPAKKIITIGMLACQFKPQSRLMGAYRSDAKLLLTHSSTFKNNC